MKVGSLFSGIGGLELGLERAGMTTIWQSEMDPYASKVLAKNFPGVPNLGDITQIDWSQVERPDLVCGGFPCQPASFAGRRLGMDDARWLWPEFARCVYELRPNLGENDRQGHALGDGCEVLADPDRPGFSEQRPPEPSCPQHAPSELGCWWDVEPDVGRVANGVPARVDRLRCLGNAVVPQVAEVVGRWIMAQGQAAA